MTFAEAATIMMAGGNVKPITITKNGKYDAADEEDSVIGYNPITVDVSPVIKSLTVKCNGTYTAPVGVDGYNPVIVNSIYETLYKLEHEITEKVGTGVTDPDGNEIVIDGIPTGNGITDVNKVADPSKEKIQNGGVSFVSSDGNNAVSVIGRVYTANGNYYVEITATNLKTGDSETKTAGLGSTSLYLGEAYFTCNGNYIGLKCKTWYPGATGYGAEPKVNLSDIGVGYLNFNAANCSLTVPY